MVVISICSGSLLVSGLALATAKPASESLLLIPSRSFGSSPGVSSALVKRPSGKSCRRLGMTGYGWRRRGEEAEEERTTTEGRKKGRSAKRKGGCGSYQEQGVGGQLG